MRNTDAAHCAARPDDAEGGAHRLLGTDTFENRVGAEAPSQCAYAFVRLFAALAYDVRRAECFRERDAIGMVTQNDDLFGAEALGSDNAAQADRTVAHHGYLFSPIDSRHPRCVMPGSHHVREREQGRHQGVVGTNRQNKERSVRLGDTQGLCLCSAGLASGPEEAAVDTRGLQPFIGICRRSTQTASRPRRLG